MFGVSENPFPETVIAGDLIFTLHRQGADSGSIQAQTEACIKKLEYTLKRVGATLDDVVQVNLLLKNADDFQKAQEVFRRVFKNGFPARSTFTTEFVSPGILTQIDAIAYIGGSDRSESTSES